MGEYWGARGVQDPFSAPIMVQGDLGFFLQPQQEEALFVSCYQLNAINEHVCEPMFRQSQCNHALMATEAYLNFLSQIH